MIYLVPSFIFVCLLAKAGIELLEQDYEQAITTFIGASGWASVVVLLLKM